MKRKTLLCSIFLVSTLLFLNAVSSILGSQSSKSILSFGTVRHSELETPPQAEFLSGFRTGVNLWYIFNSDHEGYDTWLPARQAGIVKWGLWHRPTEIHADGSCSGSWSDSEISSKLTLCFNQGIVPLIQFSRITNFEDLTESTMTNFFTKWSNWLDANYPDRFFIWSPACEFNFPDGMAGWGGPYKNGRGSSDGVTRKLDYRIFNPQMQMIRKARDDLGLQNKIPIAIHANLLKSYKVDAENRWIAQNWLTGLYGIEKYIPGFAQGDIFGVSHYYGYKDADDNSGDLTWQETLQRSWARTKIVWEKVCQEARETLPFLFIEYSMGSVWRKDKDPIWKEAVTYSYAQMLPDNTWVKGFNWYISKFIEDDAMDELWDQATAFDGYGAEGI